LAGIVKISPEYGIATLNSFSAKDRPGTVSVLSFSFDNINKKKFEKVYQKPYEPLKVTIKFNNCLLGEILLDNTC